jgi:L-lactate dehydrogenase complex protein LldF
MNPTAHAFKTNAVRAIHDDSLQTAMARAESGFVDKRRAAIDALPEFQEIRAAAKAIKDHTLEHLDYYLEHYENQVQVRGGHVHWARTPDEANQIVLDLCQETEAQRVIKGKSMVGEEMVLNKALEDAGLEVIETDLGEYIVQLAKEPPSHIIAPAVHKTKSQITELFHTHHQRYGFDKRVTEVSEIVAEARKVLRQAFLRADVGITGANFLVAETGSSVLVTNEGNGDLTSTLPRMHIVIASIDKIVPTLEDTTTILRLLGRSATGQELTSYTTFATGPRRQHDPDGPQEYHVVLLDHGRSTIIGTQFRDMLRCIRCGACLNHCPVYAAIGGHAYGWVYPGPMGSVLTPLMVGLEEAADLPNACTLNGRCQSVCPMDIPLPSMLRAHRIQAYEDRITPARMRVGLSLWAALAKRPRLYHWLMAVLMRLLGFIGDRRGRFRFLPLAGGWTSVRDLPAPQGETFQAAWKKGNRGASS